MLDPERGDLREGTLKGSRTVRPTRPQRWHWLDLQEPEDVSLRQNPEAWPLEAEAEAEMGLTVSHTREGGWWIMS